MNRQILALMICLLEPSSDQLGIRPTTGGVKMQMGGLLTPVTITEHLLITTSTWRKSKEETPSVSELGSEYTQMLRQ